MFECGYKNAVKYKKFENPNFKNLIIDKKFVKNKFLLVKLD